MTARKLDDQNDTIAEIPGTDKKDEVVMLGAHLDSWHTGTGATDNGAGTIVMMEAVRILKALDLKPRRTIRIGLWSGEEEGLLGSEWYVEHHFGSRPESKDPERKGDPSVRRRENGPMTIKPEQQDRLRLFQRGQRHRARSAAYLCRRTPRLSRSLKPG